MFVIGTAGHVDHGKSTLVRALTGINPDRLREEQERQMTIDLGFAWFTLPNGTEVSIVDVPGHEDFIKNMLAGVGGVDIALLVVAADEAVMPQTREHLAIIDLLRIPAGVIALTKTDLVDDADWLDLVTEEVRTLVAETSLGDAAIIPVSATTGTGLDALLAELERLTRVVMPRRDLGRPRMPIDRVFTIPGFGAVITGTLSDGNFAVGDEIEILPDEISARIRGLQTHKTQISEVLPGYRVAMNLGRVASEELRRGQVVCRPGTMQPTLLADVRLRVLADAPLPIEHNAMVEFFSGTSRLIARIRLLDADVLAPGEAGFVQVQFTEPAVVARGDRFILRSPSPSATLGGGEILQAHPERRYKRFDKDTLRSLEVLSTGEAPEVLYSVLEARRYLPARELILLADLPQAEAVPALASLLAERRVLALSNTGGNAEALLEQNSILVADSSWERMMGRAVEELMAYHLRYPLRSGMPREELRSRLRLTPEAFTGLLGKATEEGRLAVSPTTVHLPDFQVTLSAEQQIAVDRLLAQFRDNPYLPPTVQQAEVAIGADLLEHLIEAGILIKVSDEVLFEATSWADMRDKVVSHLQEKGQITVAELRDLFDTSRRYALAFLEDLDRRHVTRRIGDVRMLR